MRRLDLDFWRVRPASLWAGWLLLAISLALALDLALSYRALREQAAARSAQLARQFQRADQARRIPAGERPVSSEEIALAHDTIRRLARPWHELFHALEASARPDVALLSVQPDAASGALRISGESTDYAAALGYVESLSRTRTLGAVHLTKHETLPGDARRAVTFSLAASWKEAR